MTQIILVRHGRTIWNKQEIFRGTKDVPLDDHGRLEATYARERLKDEQIHVAYSSPLSRAVETSQIILEPHGIKAQIHDGLIDLNYGDWQGISHEEVKRLYPDLYKQWKEAPHTVVFPNGEGLDSVRDRVMELINHILDVHSGRTVLLAAHRVVNKVLITALLGLDNSHFWQIGQDTAAINIFRYSDKRWICCLLNDTCHLKGLEERVTVDF